MVTRRKFMKISGAVGAASLMPKTIQQVLADILAPGLSDPAFQPKFQELARNALDPGFIYQLSGNKFDIAVRQTMQMTGLLNSKGKKLKTPVWGYGGNDFVSWPGRTFQIKNVAAGGDPVTKVRWRNKLVSKGKPLPHLLPVDTSLHWAYSLPGYENFRIEKDGVPIVTHLHGGHSDFEFDGNPEFFWSPNYKIVGPQWFENGLNGIIKDFVYDNDVPAGNLWYHDHALGITRLNVYAGLAGFYFVRDNLDTGQVGNPLGLPAFPYELAYAIQDRMFSADGRLFYPAFPGDPFYADFITGEGAILPPDIFPGGGPTALAEFFGDHMVVNGRIWPKADVEPRQYRLRLLNGCDSRFLGVRFRAVPLGATNLNNAGAPLPFWVIGSDQGLATMGTETDTLLIGAGERYDVVFNFNLAPNMRVIMENIGGDAPFGGDLVGPGFPNADLFPNRQTDRIMAFDVVVQMDNSVADAFVGANFAGPYTGNLGNVSKVRRVALFEGNDEFGRLQPLLGTAEPTLDEGGNTVNGALAWANPTTERPRLNTTEIWEIYNATADAHPVHLHLVNFEILDRQAFNARLIEQPLVQHNGTLGVGFRLENIRKTGQPTVATGVEKAPKDMVTALPGDVTRIKVTFDKTGRYVWHCHILSHEDHEMMRVLQVV